MVDQSKSLKRVKVDAGLQDLYREYSDWLTARLRRRFGDEAEDFGQEAWVRIAPYARSGRVEHPKALLLRIVDNLAADQARRRQARKAREPSSEGPVAEVDIAPQVDLILLKQIIQNMPPRLREVFVLSRFAHLEYQEIGERLNVPVTTVQWRMRKALDYCAAQLRL
jgi:RNA polymerase sigma factor (sigma-70 family)